MRKIVFTLALLFSVVASAQKTYEFQKIQLSGVDHPVNITVTLDPCIDIKTDYCLASIDIEQTGNMRFLVDKTTRDASGKLMLEMTSEDGETKADLDINPEENAALFIERGRGLFAFFKKQEVETIFQLIITDDQ